MTGRQLWPLLFGALLAPAARLLPARTAPLGGALAWCSGLVALPAALAFAAVLLAVSRLDGARPDYFGALRFAWGRAAGSVLAGAYLLWGTVLLGKHARLYALQFLSTGYRNAPGALFIVVVLALSWWLARGSAGRFARAGQIFYLALTGALFLALVLALPQTDLKNLAPVGGAAIWGAVKGSGAVLSVLGETVFAAFLGARVRREAGSLDWAVKFCLAACALQLVCLAAFGAELVSQMESPLFMMIKGVGVQGGFEHIESVLIAVWSLSDLLLCGVLTMACREIGGELLPAAWGKCAAAGVVLAGGAAAWALFPDAYTLNKWEKIGRWTVGLMGFAVPIATLALGKCRQRYKK